MQLSRTFTSFRFSASRHWPWLAGAVLLLASAIFALVEYPAMRAQNHELEQQIRALQKQLRAPVQDHAAQHVDLRTRLAGRERLSLVTSDLQSMAAQNGLTLSDATYQPQEDASAADIGRIDITADLKGSYPSLKKTLASLLATHDGLALESVSLRRARSTDAAMEIEVKFSFFYRKRA